MREFDQTWSSNTSSGAQTAVKVLGAVMNSQWAFRASSGVATATIGVQEAATSSGPWYERAGSTALTSGTMLVLPVTGPLMWVRPYCGSTGITVRAVGVS